MKMILILACLSLNLSAQNTPEPKKNMLQITFSDSTQYESHSSSGVFGLLSINGVFIDTVDISSVSSFPISGYVIYQKVTRGSGFEVAPTAVYGYPLSYLRYDVQKQTSEPLAQYLPRFNDYLSYPKGYFGTLYYWGFKSTDMEGDVKHFAMQHSFKTGRTDSLSLFEGFLETDYPDFFKPPVLKKTGIRFGLDSGDSWLVHFKKKTKKKVR